jgi:aminopeptidase YwaD
MGSISPKWLWVPFATAGLLLAACNGASSATDPTATATAALSSPTREASPTPASSSTATIEPSATTPSLDPTSEPAASSAEDRAEPSGQRILDDVITLSVGPRSSATERERIAADEIADRLRSLGYEVSIQEFTVGTEQGRSSVMSLISPQQDTIPTLPLANSPTDTVRGNLVYVRGAGQPDDFPDDIEGAIALIERGTLFFQDKVQNAADAGAIGVVIYNNEAGTFFGSADSVALPTVTISQDQGQKLVQALQSGPIVAEIGVGSLSDALSRNVIAKPPGAECETYSGGHYDSVPQAPGASDNATGTATVLEIASVLMARGETGNNCFILFGAEELGLLGSRYFVSTLTQEERDNIKAMLNFDMVGVGDDTWWLVGTPELQQRMGALASSLGIDTVPSDLIGTSSDHASFIAAGIPALLFHRWQDPLLHTPQDVASRVRPELLEQAARMGLAFLEVLDAQG